jgi:hypothetical protein
MKHLGILLTATVLLVVLGTSLGCRDYCRGSGYNVDILHDGDVAAQIALRLSDGEVISPDSLQPGERFAYADGPDGEMRITFDFANGRDTALVLDVDGCGIYQCWVDSLEGVRLEHFIPE